ncbi:protein FAM114A2-like isoform X2 [Branchiostoma floridae]|uniref:Protein FAM114A2-like isoform X2 n=1 Tax=Branchiostoma floridae TaxID=7739 RepID=A0A9J7LFK7_BRAFL|nr:protein FAM114A2-like isoform X2 [Branchiostoma floridae]
MSSSEAEEEGFESAGEDVEEKTKHSPKKNKQTAEKEKDEAASNESTEKSQTAEEVKTEKEESQKDTEEVEPKKEESQNNTDKAEPKKEEDAVTKEEEEDAVQSTEATPTEGANVKDDEVAEPKASAKSTDEDSKEEVKEEKEPGKEEDKVEEPPKDGEDMERKPIPLRKRPGKEEEEKEEKIHSALDKLAGEEKPSGGWGWGGWGSSFGSSLMSTASAVGQSFVSVVEDVESSIGSGLTTVVHGVESSLGIPPPEEMSKDEAETAKEDKSKEEKEEKGESDETKETKEEKEEGAEGEASPQQTSGGGLWGALGVSMVANVVQNTTKKVVSGTLDSLEYVGKKTMDVLAEGDPGYKKTKHIIEVAGQKSHLSQVLREAKEEAEQRAKEAEEEEAHRKANFGIMFDEFQGLAHLEALEMLSNQSEGKVQAVLSALSGEEQEELKAELIQVKEAFKLEDVVEEEAEAQEVQEFAKTVTELLFELHIGMTPDKLNKAQTDALEYLTQSEKDLEEGETKDPQDLHTAAIQMLAELTAKSIHQFLKAAELILMQKDPEKTPLERAQTLTKLTSALCEEVSVLSNKYCVCLNTAASKAEKPDDFSHLITNVYLEASNSASYIQDAFQLLLPIIQESCIQTKNLALSAFQKHL